MDELFESPSTMLLRNSLVNCKNSTHRDYYNISNSHPASQPASSITMPLTKRLKKKKGPINLESG